MKKINAEFFASSKMIIIIGILLFCTVLQVSMAYEKKASDKDTQKAVETLNAQCINYNKLLMADQAKSLFRLADNMLELSRELKRTPSRATEDYFEDFAKNFKISGLALLTPELEPEVFYYKINAEYEDWSSIIKASQLKTVAQYPKKVFTERIDVNGAIYDVCAVGRLDAPGVILGFFEQSKGLLTDTQNDLNAILSGLYMERRTTFFITDKNGMVLASNDSDRKWTSPETKKIIKTISAMDSNGKLKFFRAGGKSYYGKYANSEGYQIYIYFPIISAYGVSITVAILFAAFYITFWLIFFASKSRLLHRTNSELQKTVNMLNSLESIYFAGFYVDIDNNRYDALFFPQWLSYLENSGNYTKLVEALVEKRVLGEYKASIAEVLSLEHIKEALKEETISDIRHSFYEDYRVKLDGKTNWRRVTVTAADFGKDGKPSHVLAVFQNIDDEKAKEQEYQDRIKTEAETAKRANIAKTEFLRRISHDIRTPVNGISGLVKMAEKYPEDIAVQAMCRAKTENSLKFLMDLVNHVLDMSKLETGDIVIEKVPFDLAEIFREVNSTIEVQAVDAGIDFRLEDGCEIPAVRHLIGSPLHIRQILLNIVSNAVKYGRRGGYVRTSNRISAQTDSTVTYEFICEDNGIGMSREFQEHMFEPFAQEDSSARSSYQGTGLGLAIVKTLIEKMGGKIEVESEKDKGSKFTITLTFEIDKNYAKDDKSATDDTDNLLDGMHILLVEDNELNSEIAHFVLAERGAAVTIAKNGSEAVEIFKASKPQHFDFILMDIMMPVMDGLEATKKIRALSRSDAADVPIIAMSANAFHDDVQRSIAAGMNDHISKPIDEKKLFAVIGKYIKN